MAQAIISRLSRVAGKARSTIEPTYKFAEKHVAEQYHKTMEAHQHYVVEDDAAASKLFKQWFFTKLDRQVETDDYTAVSGISACPMRSVYTDYPRPLLKLKKSGKKI